MIELPNFNTTKDRINYLISNKSSLIAQKKSVIKHADSVSFSTPVMTKGDNTLKANQPIDENMDSIKVKVVMNTTNLIDSHQDLHIKNLWNKSINENKYNMHLQEHQMKYDHIIADGDEVKVYAKDMSWSELGLSKAGFTQALIFESDVKRENNAEMFKRYAKGKVRNHSVGMQYIKIMLAVNDPEYKEEFDNWNKYLPLAINPEKGEQEGYFWVVQEAKLIEGSAVPMGSNWMTPTLDNNIKSEPPASTQEEQQSNLDTEILEAIKYVKSKINS